MAIRCYLAMTAAEFGRSEHLPEHIGWMACHFSSYGTGLSNLPLSLPAGAMLIVNDRTPVHKHDPALILDQLSALLEAQKPNCILLDFQRPGQTQTAAIAKYLTQNLSCPVGVSEPYVRELDCPVFLSPPQLHVPLEEHLASWRDRQIWLEAALESEIITVTKDGSRIESTEQVALEAPVFEEEGLHCCYHIALGADRAVFRLNRDRSHLANLLEQSEKLGVTQAVGLYQQLG